MGSIILKLLVLIALGVTGWYIFRSDPLDPLPTLDPEEWWNVDDIKGKQDISIRPFRIKFEQQVIKDLQNRLNSHRPFTPPLEGVAFEYGFNTKQLRKWTEYWAEEYPFSQREQFLNKYPQFKTNIQGLDVHFIRVKPKIVPQRVEVVPLLLVHGWPGSVREFYEVIPLLSRHSPGYEFAFELIVPSIPGYGFSNAPVRPGLAIPQVAVIFRNLMHRLGHKKYYVHGGDWGFAITGAMATLFPEDVLGYHTTMTLVKNPTSIIRTLIGAIFPSLVVESNLADRMYPLSKKFQFYLEEFGYLHIQATKPDTIGVALTDSPSGLLAYILQKFSMGPDNKFKPDGGLAFRFTKEQLVDNLMIYWISNSITTSMRFYAENFSKKEFDINMNILNAPVSVPTWILQAKYELTYQPSSILRLKYKNLINATVLDDGGHFLAMELPMKFAEDVFKAVESFREWRENKKDEL